MNRGKLVIVGILVVASAMAGFAWWFHRQQGQQVLAFWGSDVAYLIRCAEEVQWMRLEGRELTAEENLSAALDVIPISGQRAFVATDVCQISKARGLVHARQALIQDASFAWGVTPDAAEVVWRYGLRFVDGTDEVVLLFDETCQWVRTADDARLAKLTIADGLVTFFSEQSP